MSLNVATAPGPRYYSSLMSATMPGPASSAGPGNHLAMMAVEMAAAEMTASATEVKAEAFADFVPTGTLEEPFVQWKAAVLRAMARVGRNQSINFGSVRGSE